jgi:DeoR/GlpR family transcriptional regulator of sugar metabolism
MNKKEKTLIPERLAKLRDIARERRVVRVDELCVELGVSRPTVRRDLVQLEKSGVLRRVHGGAISMETNLEEPLFDDKTSMATREKRQIAEVAADLVAPGETIYLDGGSTLLELARILRIRTDIRIVKNSLRTTIELSGSGPQVTLIGGKLRRRSQTMVGALTQPILEKLHFDAAFMGTIGLTIKDGLTTTDPDEAFTKQLAMRRSDRVILLVDSSKIGKVSFARAGTIKNISVLVTDKKTNKKFLTDINKMGIATL